MADLTGRNADETKPDIATWGSGNVLETGEGVVKVDLDGKVAISDIINNLTSEDENKPLSAKQGKQLNEDKASLSALGDAAFEDYEEGTWNPEYIPQNGSFGNIEYSRQNGGRYVEIGDFVFISARIRTSELSQGTASGFVFIKLPFVASQVIDSAGLGNNFGLGVSFADDFAGAQPAAGSISPGTSNAVLRTSAYLPITVDDLTFGTSSANRVNIFGAFIKE